MAHDSSKEVIRIETLNHKSMSYESMHVCSTPTAQCTTGVGRDSAKETHGRLSQSLIADHVSNTTTLRKTRKQLTKTFKNFTKVRRHKNSMSHTIPQLQSIFSRMMQLVGKTGGFPSTGPGTEDYSWRNGITLSKPLARSHDITVHVVYQLMMKKRKRRTGREKVL